MKQTFKQQLLTWLIYSLVALIIVVATFDVSFRTSIGIALLVGWFSGLLNGIAQMIHFKPVATTVYNEPASTDVVKDETDEEDTHSTDFPL